MKYDLLFAVCGFEEYLCADFPARRNYAVKMAPAAASVDVPGAVLKSATKAKPKIRVAAETLRPSDMPDAGTMEAVTEADFDPRAVIRSIEGGKNYQLGASWAYYAASAYYIPADASISGAIDLNGGFAPHSYPVLYVAGKLHLTSLHIGLAQLVVLPGGEVSADDLTANANGRADKPAVYIFEDGKLTVENANLSGRSIVNRGVFYLDDDLDMNNGSVVYNAAGAVMKADEVKCTHDVKIHNDGNFEIEDLRLNSQAEYHNYQNGDLSIDDECVFERNTTIYQNGCARIGDMTARGTIYVNCHTVVDEIDASGADIRIGAGAALEADEVECNNTRISMGGGAAFFMEEYNADKKGGKTYFTYATQGDDALAAVVLISEKAYSRQGHDTHFSGRIEVVYDNDADKKYRLERNFFDDGAVMRPRQTVVIPESFCNGGRLPVVPEPEPEPAEEYVSVEGLTYTYCFEDNWPYLGDYDMNDVVLVCSVDRMVSKDGGKVASMVINWELKAAGTTFELAGAVQLDAIRTAEIASTVSTHEAFGSGAFPSRQPQSDSELAVIPFFNKTDELLGMSNTWKDQAVATTRHKTSIVFSEPVEAAKTVESKFNFFITAKSRETEIHLPTYGPTAAGVVGKGSFLPEEPYKFYDVTGDRAANNHMMWALRIPGDFRYPAEGKDIRRVYTYFLDWAASNGEAHAEWYAEEAAENLLF